MAASETRKDCLSADHRCWSPLACSSFGYCRVRNFSQPYDAATDSHWSYLDAIEAIRLRKIASGEIKPEPTEDIRRAV